ncbi:MAG: MFS transporter [Firmicutes bacterium]|nr:MFS transporter [Alicyclobacillaceae bacterium]MCL6497775.1 MFS transporter [Bacillota bacterium]
MVEKAPPVWDSLGVPAYRTLWLAVTAGNSGRWAATMAVGWLVHTWTHSAFWVGAAMFAMQGPILVFAPVAGVLLDRFHRARLLSAAFALGALATFAMALAARFDLGLGWLLAAALGFGIAFSFQSTTWTTLVAPLVPKAKLSNAIALISAARQGTEFVGPALATPILLRWGSPAVFVTATVLLILATALALTLGGVRAAGAVGQAGARAPEGSALAEGIRYVRRHAALDFLIFFIGVHCVLTMAYQGVLPSVVARDLGAAAGAYGAVMTAIGVGALVGSLALARIRAPETMGRALGVTTLLSGLSVVLLGVASTVPVAALAGFLMGLSQTPFMALTQVFVQERVENAYRGRVTSLRSVVAQGTMSLGNWAWGLVAVALPPGLVLVMLGGGFVVAAAVARGRSATFRHLLAPARAWAAQKQGAPAPPL